LPILLPLAVVAVPLIDMALAFIRRLGKGQSPFKPDAHHLHHRLLRFGHTHRWAVAVLWLWTFVLSFGTVSMVFLRLRYAAGLLVAGFLVASILTFSPAVRRLIWRLWRGVGAVAVPPRRAEGLGRARPRGDTGQTGGAESSGERKSTETGEESGSG
jgi:UDP-GlcNAc:undecaprenyl-phosphate GlcNAc-1-phosphate transferase